MWDWLQLQHKHDPEADKSATLYGQIAKILVSPGWHKIDFWKYLCG